MKEPADQCPKDGKNARGKGIMRQKIEVFANYPQRSMGTPPTAFI